MNSLPGIGNRASPYPAGTVRSRVITIVMNAVNRLFPR